MKKQIKPMTAITARLCLFALILWGTSMFCVTYAVTQNYFQMLADESYGFADYVTLCGRLSNLFEIDEDAAGTYEYKQTVPGYTEYCMLEAITRTNRADFQANRYLHDTFSVVKNESIPMQTAVIFIDKDGNVIHQSGDFIYFRYVTDNVWDEEREEQVAGGNGWINLSRNSADIDRYSLFRVAYSGVRSLYDFRALRITGYMDGAEVIPLRMDYVTDTMIRQALEKRTPDEQGIDDDGAEYIRHTYTISELDHDRLFTWQAIFDETKSAENTDELVTIYALYPQMNVYNAGAAVDYRGEKYESLLALLSTKILDMRMSGGESFYSGLDALALNKAIVFASRQVADLTQYNYELDEEWPEPEFIMLTAISSKPLMAAASALRYVYIVTFLIAVWGVAIIRKFMKKRAA